MLPQLFSQAPWDAVMPAGIQMVFTVISVVLFGLALWFVLKENRRRGDYIALYAFLGGGLISVYEPLGDTLAAVYYPMQGQIVWHEFFGRGTPVFIGVLYFWYMSIPAITFLRQTEKGITRRSLWGEYLFTVALAIGIELVGVNLNAWIYYGPQPFLFYGVPLWCPVTYSGFLVTISLGLHAMATRLDRRHHWLVILGVPAFMAGGHLFVSLPASLALYSTNDPLWLWLGASASIGLSLLLVHVTAVLHCVPAGATRAIAGRGARGIGSAVPRRT